MGKPKKGRRSDRQRYRRDGQYDVDNDEDIALLSKPFDASIKGVIDLMKAFENGTREVQYLLQYECGLLFECRVCRSIFRSIVNFITHKRVYCRAKVPSDSSQNGQSFDELMKDVQSMVIVQEPAVCEPSTSPTTVTTNNNNTITESTNEEKPSPPRLSKRKAFPRKNLIEVLDRLCQKESLNLERPVVLGSRDRACVSGVGDPKLTMPVLCLDKIEHTDVAMRQTVTLGPDGKILDDKYNGKSMDETIIEHDSQDQKSGSSPSDIKSIERLCKPCNIKFSTRKTFRQHLKSKHNSNPSWYLCPDCTSIFSQIYSVHRHLRRFHRKSESQMQKIHGKIKHMPENQLPAAYKVNVTKKPMSKITLQENKKDVVDKQGVELENELVELCLTENNTCSGCARKFDRVAAFNTHMPSCSRRLAVFNSTKSQSMFRTLLRHPGDGFLTKTNTSETVDTKTVTNLANPHYFASHLDITDDVSNAESMSTSCDFQSQSILMNHRTRHESEMRLEPPVKRIEIQLRMDYNKVNISQGQTTVSASSSDVLETSNTSSLRSSPDTVAINETIIPEENKSASTNKPQVILLSGKDEDAVRTVTSSPSSVQNNKPPNKSIMEESMQGTSTSPVAMQLPSSNNSIIDNVLTEEHITSANVENTPIVVETNSNRVDMSQFDQIPANGDVLDRSAQQPCNSGGCSIDPVADTCLEDVETKTLVEDVRSLEADNDLKTAVVTTRPKVTTQLVNSKILRYRCGECCQHFPSLRSSQSHVEKCHTTGRVWRNSARSGELTNSWTCISNTSKCSTRQTISQLETEMNGDILDMSTSVHLDSETNQLLPLPDILVVKECTSLENPNLNLPMECSSFMESATSKIAEISTTKQISKISKPVTRKENEKLIGDNKLLNTNKDNSSIIGLRPKRHRINPLIKAAANNVGTLVRITDSCNDQRLIEGKTSRKTQKGTKHWADKEKTDLHSDTKRAKVELLLTQMQDDVSLDNDDVPDLQPPTEQIHVTSGTSTPTEEVDLDLEVAGETADVLEPIKTQAQDITNIYKNVSKSVIEVIFGSELSSTMFSTDDFETEEEVTIIQDQISGTFSLDISSTPEKNKDSLSTMQNEMECSSSTRRRISFSLDSEQISSPDSGQGSSDLVLEASHSVEELLNSSDSISSGSSTVIDENLLVNNTVLEKLRVQTSCPVVLLDKSTVDNHMLAATDATSNSSAKESTSISLLKTVPSVEEAKIDVNKVSLPGYNISTRKSMRVFDTKPLRRTPPVDADVHCKR